MAPATDGWGRRTGRGGPRRWPQPLPLGLAARQHWWTSSRAGSEGIAWRGGGHRGEPASQWYLAATPDRDMDIGFEDFFVVADQNQQITTKLNSRLAGHRGLPGPRYGRGDRTPAQLPQPVPGSEAGASLLYRRSGESAPDLPPREAGQAPQLYVYRPEHLDRICRRDALPVEAGAMARCS